MRRHLSQPACFNHLDERLVDIAPTPVLPRLKGFYNRVAGSVEVFSGVLVLRGVAATDVSTAQAFAQMYPPISHC